MNRREFLGRATKAAMAFGLAAPSLESYAEEIRSKQMASDSRLKKALILSMLPGNSVVDKFQLAADLGFHGMEVSPTNDPKEIKVLQGAVAKSGVKIHSIIYGGWGKPLSSADEAAGQQAVEDLKVALRSAKELGADALLLVPGVVNPDNRYKDVYERSQRRVKSVAPYAEELGVLIAIENVWNNFLLSPLEFARYVDEIGSPYVQAYFDVGNVVGAFGFPQDWIRTLGKRIKKIHLKDFKLQGRQWVNLRDGDVNWPEVRKALDEIGYEGYMTAELPAGDKDYLRDLSARIDKIIAGE